MPVLIDRDPLGYCAIGEAGRLRPRPWAEFRADDADCIDLAFINNMPDKALEATERQFLKLIAAAADDFVVRVKFYSLPDVPRTDWGQHHLRAYYSPVADLWDSHHDALIMTGTEPRAPDLTTEPYWSTLTQVIDWAQHNVSSAVWSCLAAHAAVRHLDRIDRHALEQKCFGIFPCERLAEHPLLDGVTFPLSVPHSRWNALRADDLEAAGHTILTRSDTAGVDMFVKHDKCLLVSFQGHPEYEADTLMREYRRDVGRFLKGERDLYPALPEAYVADKAAAALMAFRERALADRREGLLVELPLPTGSTWRNRWDGAAERIYRNWLSILSAEKAQRLARLRSAARRASGGTQ